VRSSTLERENAPLLVLTCGLDGDAAYHAVILRLNGMESEEIVQGMDQLYAADYRNLVIGMQDAALVVAMYARGLESADAVRMIAALREKYRAATIAH